MKPTRPRGLHLLFLFTLTLIAVPAERSQAGSYELRACLPQAPLYFDGRYVQYKARRVDVVQTCDSQPAGKVGIYQTRKGTPFESGEGAAYYWQAPAESWFIASRAQAKLKNANGIAAQLFAYNGGGGYLSLDDGTKHDGEERELHVDFSTTPRKQVIVRLACYTNPPCSNKSIDVKAFFELRDISLRLRDTTSPTVTGTGDLFERPAPESIYRGRVNYSYTASDSGGGLRQAYAEINGSVLELATFECAGHRGDYSDRTRPCTDRQSHSGSFDTAAPPFTEGANRIRICARDYATSGAANVGCTGLRQITVDNHAPSAPVGLKVVGGEDWRHQNGFDVQWQLPSGQTTPIVAAHYRLEDPLTGIILVSEKKTVNTDGLQDLNLPRPGIYRLRVWLRDAAGNQGAAATALLRFDDGRPLGGEPLGAEEWLGAADFPYRHRLSPLEAGGPSGVAGFAFTLSREQADEPCPSGVCDRSEVTPAEPGGPHYVEIDRLGEGLHWLTSAAVSGAMLRAEQAGKVPLRVDLGDPTTRIEGVPTSWSRSPVEVTAYATDSLSGMEAEVGSGRQYPITVIEDEGGDSWQRIGSSVTATLREEGVYRLRYWARDRAGNANDGRRLANGHRHDPPGQATVRIDWTPPEVEFLEPDNRDPELIRARATDRLSGIKQAYIGYRPAGSAGDFHPLPTNRAPGMLSARLPSDALPDGRYEFEAIAFDQANNRASTSRRRDGRRMVLTLPVKPRSQISAQLLRRRPGRGSGDKRPLIAGFLLDHQGAPLPGANIEIVEDFDPGSRERQRLTRLRTDANGHFRAQLGPGPSRRVRARFRGNHWLARSESPPIRVLSRARIAMRLTPQVVSNGRAVRMSGRIWGRGARLPDGGKLVAIQFLDPSRRRWRPVELLRTDRRGRYTFRYRFRTITSPQRFLFRAVAPAEAGWPYRAAASSGNAVVVYPR